MKEDSKFAVELRRHHMLCITTPVSKQTWHSKCWFWKKTLYLPESKIWIRRIEKCTRGPREIRPSNCILKAFSAFLWFSYMRMRRNTITSTGGLKMDLKIEFPVSTFDIYKCAEVRPSNGMQVNRTITNSTSDLKNRPHIRTPRTKNIYSRWNLALKLRFKTAF